MRNKILIVDDDKAIRVLLTKLLQDECDVESARTGEEALEIAPRFLPDVVLLDIMMPGIDGYQTCRKLRAMPFSNAMQIIIVSAKSTRAEQRKALSVGAHDYVIKPFDPHELRARVGLHIRMLDAIETLASLEAEITEQNAHIKQIAEDKNTALVEIQDVAVLTLAKVAEARDNETGEHLIRMRSYSNILAEQLRDDSPYTDQVDDQFVDELYRASPLHDIGKVGISDEILLKPGKYTAEEFETMKRHTVIGANILDEAVWQQHGGEFFAMAAIIARFHHERFDGSGYLAGLVGQEIPLAARIVAVADCYDALSSERPYKIAFPSEQTKTMIEDESGKHFDPVIVRAFQDSFDEFLEVQDRFNATERIGIGAMSFEE
jgi:putative two-component system response regulator